MKSKLIFRILGALASALIIVSVFVPFISINGFTNSLWNSYQVTNSIYLPIMIMAFGLIGVIFFALNIKTEFAYMTAGAITFFVVMQTISYLDSFGSLSMGYYFLAIGAILTAVMAFICNLKTKVVVEPEPAVEEVKSEPSMLDQIDKLYNDQNLIANQTPEFQSIDNGLPIQPIGDSLVQPLNDSVPAGMQSLSSVENNSLESQVPSSPLIQDASNSMPIMEPSVEVQPTPVVQEIPTVAESNPVVEEFAPPTPTTEIQPTQTAEAKPTNPALQEFAQPEQPAQSTNPALQEFAQPEQPAQPTNPALQEFAQPTQTAEAQPTNPALQEFAQPTQPAQPTNPVVQGFMNPTPQESAPAQPQVTTNNTIEPIPTESQELPNELKPLNPVIEGFNNPNSANKANGQGSSLDIFGQ